MQTTLGVLCVLSQSARWSSWPPTPHRERFIKVKRWFPCLMWRKAFFSASTCVCSLPGPRVGLVSAVHLFTSL